MDDEIKKAEARGYSRGYAAGAKRKRREISAEARMREVKALEDRAFLAILPFAMSQNGWKFGDEPITSSTDRIRFAWVLAEKAAKHRY